MTFSKWIYWNLWNWSELTDIKAKWWYHFYKLPIHWKLMSNKSVEHKALSQTWQFPNCKLSLTEKLSFSVTYCTINTHKYIYIYNYKYYFRLLNICQSDSCVISENKKYHIYLFYHLQKDKYPISLLRIFCLFVLIFFISYFLFIIWIIFCVEKTCSLKKEKRSKCGK